jgi:hypothetical protein
MTDEITELPTKLNRLPDEDRLAKRAAITARKVFASAFSPFVRIMREAMTAYLQARSEGLQRADAIKGLEFTLRESWPKAVTKFPAKCEACDDTGYQESICRPYVRCERESCQRKGEAFQHAYVRPCECAKGQAFNRKANPPQEWVQDSVGKVSKKKGWSRMGQ